MGRRLEGQLEDLIAQFARDDAATAGGLGRPLDPADEGTFVRARAEHETRCREVAHRLDHRLVERSRRTTGATRDHQVEADVAGLGDEWDEWSHLLFANRAWGDCGHDGALSSSYATALVSGSVALLRQRFPQESAAQIIHRLEVTASRPQRDARDDIYGWGVVQPFEAMTWAYDGSVGGPPAPGAEPRVTPSSTPQALDLTPVPDPNADQRQTTLWLLLGTGSTVLALGMWGMIRRARRETERA